MNGYRNIILTILLIQFSQVFSSPRINSGRQSPEPKTPNIENFDAHVRLTSPSPKSNSPAKSNVSGSDQSTSSSLIVEPPPRRIRSVSTPSSDLIIFHEPYDIAHYKKRSAKFTTQNARKKMEDFYIRIESYGIFAVLDGHGGDYAAWRARVLLVEKITNYIKSGKNDFQNELFIHIEQIENQLRIDWASELHNSGTTLVLGVIHENELIVANVGDSRAVFSYDNGASFNSTRDHKPNDPIEKERILDAGGEVTEKKGVYRVNGALAMSRSLGDFHWKITKGHPISAKPDIYEWNLNSQPKFLIFASDGLWDTVNNEEAIELINAYYLIDSDFGARRLAELAQQNFSKDNITLVIVVFRNGKYRVSRSKLGPFTSV